MKAIVCSKYGSPDVLQLEEVEKPATADDLVLVRVRAASVNPADWYGVAGPLIVRPSTGFLKPRNDRTGIDFAGTVEAVGKDITHVRPGDEVFGAKSGALAEYVSVRDAVVPKPANISFEEAAAVPVAAITALQGLRDKGQLQAGQRVLINGASGGVGTFAVQIAKALGAEVTAVCSTRNVELVRSLGADHVIDYTREDFTRSDRRYDLLLDVAGSKQWSALRRVLTPEARVVIVGAQKRRVLGPLGHIVRLRLASLRGSQKAVFFIAKTNRADMEILRELLETGKVKPVVDRRYDLADTADAFRYLGEGHARGKIVVTL
ncbi:MAG TPA: NAD(P)-dependent alcohol dehydrogenase [Gaiellaceae bacterium]|nr:NAD(P)-dependent alcohol dehydrogenase [Gaiellaceae bacterium]